MIKTIKRIRWSGAQIFVRCRQVGLVLLVQLGLACGALGAETDEEMIQRVGVDPRDITRALADFSPDKLPGLACWLRADAGVTADAEGLVSSVQEQSPARLRFTQAEARRQPVLIPNAINGQPALRFATRPDQGGRMISARDLQLTAQNGVTLLAVARIQTATYYGQFVTAFDAQRRDYMLGQENMTGALRGGIHESLAGRGFKVLPATYDAGTKQYTAHENGKRVAQQEQPLAPMTVGELRLGWDSDEEFHSLVGDIAEAMIFTRPLMEAERTALVSHLMKKYALTTGDITALAAKLPYAYYPSSNELEVAFDTDSPLLAEYFSGVYRPAVIPGANEQPGLAFACFTDEQAHRQLDGLDKLTPAQTGVLPQPDILAPDGKPFTAHPPKPHLLVFSGYLNVPRDDAYTFQVRPYCDSLLLLDGAEVTRISSPSSYNYRGGALALGAGKHALTFHVLVRNQPVELPTTLLRWSFTSFGW